MDGRSRTATPIRAFSLPTLLLLAAVGTCTFACSKGAAEENRPPEELELQAEPADFDFPKPKGAPQGRWRVARTLDEQIEELESIGYAAGTEVAPSEMGVVVNDPRAYRGLNFYTSGHGPEILLVDMEGRELHRWRRPFAEAVPGFKSRLGSRGIARDFYRRAYLYPNGDLLGIFEGHALVKLDRDSKVLWAFEGLAHHDLDVLPDGRIFVLTRKGKVLPRIHPTEPVLEDFVTILGADGSVQRNVSVLECFEGSQYEHFLERIDKQHGDFFHTNTVEVLDGRFADRHPAFARGNVLISIWRLDTIAILDFKAKTVVWALAEGWEAQHQPTFLEDGDMLLFDNLGGDAEHGRSRVIQFDPVDYAVSWSYEGDAEHPFQTDTCGAGQRLPNGNTLLTESDNGRAFEVTRGGEIVWEFVSPHRAGEHGELIATLFEVVRLPPDFEVGWAQGIDAGSTDRPSGR